MRECCTTVHKLQIQIQSVTHLIYQAGNYWGVPEMIYCVFLLWSKNCRWNRVKMVKNGPKMAEIILGASHVINNNIFNIFCFSTFSFGYFLDLVFRAIFSKFGQNTGFVKYPKEKVKKLKISKMLSVIICEAPKNFNHLLAIFTLFHLTNWLYVSPKTRIRQFG